MTKEKDALLRIYHEVKHGMNAWKEFDRNPENDDAVDAFVCFSLSSQELISIFEALEHGLSKDDLCYKLLR